MSLRPGDVFAGYTIERELGSGGMGSVYLAQHPRLPRMDALKLLRPELCSDTSFVQRFEREADMVARLDHPNIVSVHDRGSQDGQLWISMRFIDGTNAEQALRDEPAGMPPQRVVRIIGKVASALDYAHRHGLLHRDVKPANILLTPGSEDEDEQERVFLSDFGVAKAIGEASDSMSALTSTGSVVATLDYASPEQIKGQGLDHRSDIYALGCVLYKLLTGNVPYPAESVVARVYGHLNNDIPRPTAAVASLPAGFDDVIAKAMAKERDDRYQTCRAMAVAARAALGTAPASAGAPERADDGLQTTVYPLPTASSLAYPGSSSGPAQQNATSAATQANVVSSEPPAEGLPTVASGPAGEPWTATPASVATNSAGPADVSANQTPVDGAAPRRTLEQPAFAGLPAGGLGVQPPNGGNAGPSQAGGYGGPPPEGGYVGPSQAGGYGSPPGGSGRPPGGPPDGSPRHSRRWPLIAAIVAAVLIAVAGGTWLLLRNSSSGTAAPGPVASSTSAAVQTSAVSGSTGSPSAAPSSPAPSSAAPSSAVVSLAAGPVPGLPHGVPLSDRVLVGSRTIDGSSNLHLYDGSTGELGQPLTSGSPGTQYPVLSADRGSVIYLQTKRDSPKSLRTIAVDGTGDRELFSTFPEDCGDFYRPAWNPADQTEIALPCISGDGSVVVYRIGVDGKARGTITTGLTVVDDLTYSPDGSLLAFWGSESVGGQSVLFVQPADGSSPPRRVVQPPDAVSDVDPVFSPDAGTITFRRVTKDAAGAQTSRLFQVGLDGSNLRPLTDAGYLDLDPSYSPDGSQIVFRSIGRGSGGGRASALWVIGADGGGLRELAADAPGIADSAPAWTRR